MTSLLRPLLVTLVCAHTLRAADDSVLAHIAYKTGASLSSYEQQR